MTNLLLLEELNGVELGIAPVRQLRREEPTVAVIVASAASYKEREVLKLGAHAFLDVPLLSTDELVTTAERPLEDRERRQQRDLQQRVRRGHGAGTPGAPLTSPSGEMRRWS
jgi:DNA-binding NtrC family response regulator